MRRSKIVVYETRKLADLTGRMNGKPPGREQSYTKKQEEEEEEEEKAKAKRTWWIRRCWFPLVPKWFGKPTYKSGWSL